MRTKKQHPAILNESIRTAAGIGLDSSSPDWLFECEVRELSKWDQFRFRNFIANCASKRGEEAAARLERSVAERKSAMEMLRVDHPYIDMKKFYASSISQPLPEQKVDAELAGTDEAAPATAVTQPPSKGLFAPR